MGRIPVNRIFNQLVEKADKDFGARVYLRPNGPTEAILTRITPKKNRTITMSEIFINSRLTKIKRIWALAHELGHLDRDTKLDTDLFSKTARQNAIYGASTYLTLEGEVKAWAYADKLIAKIEPRLYTTDYLKHKHSQLRTYYRFGWQRSII